MIKKMLATIGLVASLASPALAWDLNALNKTVDETNYYVGYGCSGTLISTEEKRLILTAYHCINDYVSTQKKPQRDIDGNVITGPNDKPVTKKITQLYQIPVMQVFWNDELDKDKDTRADAETLIYTADIVARNAAMDLAILEIPKEMAGVPLGIKATGPATMAVEDYKVQRGEPVWAVGNSLGVLYSTVTRGIVSSERHLDDLGDFFDQTDSPPFFVQLDAGIAPGNSGGSLYNDNGELIGVNTLGVPGTSLAFAVPIKTVWKLLKDNCLADEVGGENAAKCGVTINKTDTNGVDGK